MDASERDEIPMRPMTIIHSGYQSSSATNTVFSTRTRSASMSIPTNSLDSSDLEPSLVHRPLENWSFLRANRSRISRGVLPKKNNNPIAERCPSLERTETNEWPADDYTGKNEPLLRSGQLGMCNDPYCTSCPMYHNMKQRQMYPIQSEMLDAESHNMIRGDAKGWAKRMYSYLRPYIPGVMNPHAKAVQQWNKFFLISCLFAIFLDPLFFFLLCVQKDNKCIVLNMPMTTTIFVLRSITDFVYLFHILLQFRLAYVAPESRVVGAGDLVDDPKMIARNYLFGYFTIDFFFVLPLPQIIILLVLTDSVGSSDANYANNLLRAAIFIQYIPRLYRFLPLVAGSSQSGFIFESAWANFVMNLLTFVLGSHVIGSGWYLFGLQRVNQCFRDACKNSKIEKCMQFIDCGHGNSRERFGGDPAWDLWKNNVNATACFSMDGFEYGIYQNAVNLTTRRNIVTRYVYSLFWGFQQISTLAGNQVPSYFLGEVLFTMAITGTGLLLFAWLIGNMQHFLQALGRRRLEMSLRRRDVEQWMSHRRLPEDLRRQVRDSERLNWAVTRGVNDETLMENLPEDLQREIRRHLFKFIKKVRIIQFLEEPIIDAICERLRTKTYIKGSKILFQGGLVDKMVFIIRGKMESIGEDQVVVPLSEGDVCGEELLTWCLEHSSANKDRKINRIIGHRLLSNRLVWCLTNVKAFVLRSADLEEVTSLFARFLRNQRVQGAIRYESPYWRGLAVKRIQVAWRYRKKRINRASTSSPHRVISYI